MRYQLIYTINKKAYSQCFKQNQLKKKTFSKYSKSNKGEINYNCDRLYINHVSDNLTNGLKYFYKYKYKNGKI